MVQIADVPVPFMVSLEVSKVFSQDRVQQQSQSKSLTFQFCTAACTLQDPGLASHSQEIAGEAFQMIFSTFPRRKKSAPFGPHSGSELSADFSSSSPPAQLASPFLREGFFEDESGGMWMRLLSGRWYLLCSDPEVFWDGPG